jgi:hypothetical protein
VGLLDTERTQQVGGVVGHVADGETFGRQRRPSGPAVVEGGQPVTVGQPVQLKHPGVGGVAQPGDQQHVGAVASLFDPQLDLADGDRSGLSGWRCSSHDPSSVRCRPTWAGARHECVTYRLTM